MYMGVNLVSSKGNQLKWFDGEYWYKADFLGYEALVWNLTIHCQHSL